MLFEQQFFWTTCEKTILSCDSNDMYMVNLKAA